MAGEFLIAAMKGQRQRAVFAFDPLPTLAAGDEGGKPSPVEQHHDLFPGVQPLSDGPLQGPRKQILPAGLDELGPHINDLDVRQRAPLDALGHFQQPILAALDIVPRLEARRRRTQHDRRPGRLGANDRYVASVVARRFLLLVTGFVLFVDDDQSEVLERSENGRAGADDHRGFPLSNSPPLGGALKTAKGAMQDGYLAAEAGEKLRGNGWGQGDFGDQQQRASTRCQGLLDSAKVDFRLARAGDAAQQEHLVDAAAKRGAYLA